MGRRDFLRQSAFLVGSGVCFRDGLTSAATGTVPTSLPRSSRADSRPTGVLVAYASRCGSTADIAQTIGQTIATRGVRVDVLPIKAVTDVACYRAVIIGSAIRRGNWLGEARDFVARQRTALGRTRVAYFTVCMTLARDTPEKRLKAMRFLDAVRAVVRPAAEGFFAGRYDPACLSFIERRICQAIGVPVGDFRDWDAIKRWSGETYALLA